MPFAEERVSYDDTKKRTSTAYVKFTPEYRIVLRILDDRAKLAWKHWVKEANGGRGLMATCPNTTAQTRVCPIDKQLEGLDKTDEVVKERRAKKRYMVNVLDRTPYTVCEACNEQTPGIPKGNTKICQNCGADVKKSTFAPLNKIKILEGGPRLFLETLNPIEQMQAEDHPDSAITDYDITFQTQGEGRERKISAVPQAPSVLSSEDFIDTETGEEQKPFPLDVLAEPNTIEEIELMLQGATVADLNALQGIV